MKKFELFEPVRMALIISLSVGMGIAFHEVFFLLALVLAAIALVQAIYQRVHRATLTHRRP
jgi:predicted membrane protein